MFMSLCFAAHSTHKYTYTIFIFIVILLQKKIFKIIENLEKSEFLCQIIFVVCLVMETLRDLELALPIIYNKYHYAKIYIIRNKINDWVYIGATINIASKRLTEHKSNATNNRFIESKFYKAMNEIGHDNFYIEIIEYYSCENEKELHEREDGYILLNDSINNGYNSQFNTKVRINLTFFPKKDEITTFIENPFKLAKIYKITNDIDDLVYIGCTCSLLERRLTHHKNDSIRETNKNRKFSQFILSHGIEHSNIHLIENYPCENLIQLLERESYWIKKFNSVENGLNSVGDGTDEKREKIRKEWLEENHIKVSEWKKEWYKRNKDEILEIRKEYYEDNREKKIEYQKEYVGKNKEKVDDYQTKYRNDPENKKKISLQRSQMLPCPLCDKEVTRTNLGTHIKSVHKFENHESY